MSCTATRPRTRRLRLPLGELNDHRHDFARFGELDGVAEQVREHLSQSARIADEAVADLRIELVGQLQPFRLALHGHQFQRLFHALAQIERRVVELEPAGLDLREIEDLVDQGQ
jgi:hypothetical protein